MTIVRMPLVSSVDPDAYSNGIITKGSSVQNIIYTSYPGDKVYASQRPAINITSTNSGGPEDQSKGRGITYWDLADDFYFVQDDTVYKGDHTNAIKTISGGRDKVFFAEVGLYLALIDPENNEGWYIDSAVDFTTVTEITNVNFPPKQTPTLNLAGGAVSLNGYLFVLATDGTIWNSNLNDVTAWTAIDFIGADISVDGGVYIAKHHNHICAMGGSSMEFFYDAGNPVGSPLQLRQDISYLSGAIDFNSVSTTGENIMFLGRETIGTIGLYRLDNFKLTKESTDSIDRYIGHTYSTDSLKGSEMIFYVSSAWFGEHSLCFITACAVDDVADSGSDPVDWYDPQYTLVFDASSKLWSRFTSELSTITEFGVAGSTDSSGTSGLKGSMIFLNGSVGSVDISGVTADYTNPDEYVADDYVIEGYITPAPDSISNNICINITTVETDFDRVTRKNMHRLSVVGTTTFTGGDLTPLDVSWTDDRYRTFSTVRTLDTGLRRSLTRLGTFRRRAYSIDYCGADFLRLESLEFDIRSSEYA